MIMLEYAAPFTRYHAYTEAQKSPNTRVAIRRLGRNAMLSAILAIR